MRARARSRLTYANVVGTLALFVALGGGAYASGLISGSKLKNRSVTGAKIKKDALGGTEIRESRLGKVPRASNTDRVGGLTSSAFLRSGQATGGALTGTLPNPALRCPTGTARQSDFCFEQAIRAPANWFDAAAGCGAAGRRLGTPAEIYALESKLNAHDTGEWTSTIYDAPTGTAGGMILTGMYVQDTNQGGPGLIVQPNSAPTNTPLGYRCIASAGNP